MTGSVLIVDGDQSMAETLTRAMTRRGFVVTWKTSAADGLELLEAQDFDVVVTDLPMEGMNGSRSASASPRTVPTCRS
jgi:DNA-binding response OmpR family regulator